MSQKLCKVPECENTVVKYGCKLIIPAYSYSKYCKYHLKPCRYCGKPTDAWRKELCYGCDIHNM